MHGHYYEGMFGEKENLLSMLRYINDVPTEVIENPEAFYADFIWKIPGVGDEEDTFVRNAFELKDVSFNIYDNDEELIDLINIQGTAPPLEEHNLPHIRPALGDCRKLSIKIYEHS